MYESYFAHLLLRCTKENPNRRSWWSWIKRFIPSGNSVLYKPLHNGEVHIYPKDQDDQRGIEWYVVQTTIPDQSRKILVVLIPGTNDWNDGFLDLQLTMRRIVVVGKQKLKIFLDSLNRYRARQMTYSGEQYQHEIPYSEDEQEDQSFLFKTLRRRRSTIDLGDTNLVSMKDIGLDIDGRVHNGFHSAYQSIKNELLVQIKDKEEVFIVGHSLGAALATLAALHIRYVYPSHKLNLITLGCPKVGDSGFCQACNTIGFTHKRLVNGHDIVPKLPPLPPSYEHHIDPVKIGSRSRIPRPVGDHLLEAYCRVLKRSVKDN